MLSNLPGILISIGPVILFLVVLIFLESYKLVRLPAVLSAVLYGVLAAVVCLGLNSGLMRVSGASVDFYVRYPGPVIEEAVKGAYLVTLLRWRRIGFMVDAAIYGFAIGAGFAVTENLRCFLVLGDANVMVWIVRGFGTAVMHGGSTALFGMLSQSLAERRGGLGPRVWLPALVLSAACHALYNHFFISPVFSAVGVILALPAVMTLVFRRSETALRHWLGVGFDSDTELMAMMNSGDIIQTPLGRYLTELKTRFPAAVVADMLCLLRIHVELSIRVKGILIMREAGFELPPDPEVGEQFTELKFLEQSVGPTGRLALHPFLHRSSRDLWQLTMLKSV
jgi:RsiW-degrading membrane proteinase PrsW (M82 family)